MADRIQYRRGLASQWASVNPVLANGEPGYETDTGFKKVGNGTTPWNALPYMFGTIPAHVAQADPHTQYLLKSGGTMTGSILGPLGTVASVTYGFAGNSNTGIYSPAANILGVVTAGAERMRIDAGGNMGIGTSSNELGSSYRNLMVSGSVGAIMQVQDDSRTYRAGISVDSGGARFGVRAGGIPMVIVTDNNERMRIDASGNVGIGTATPGTFGKFASLLGSVSTYGPSSCAWYGGNGTGELRLWIANLAYAGVAANEPWLHSYQNINIGSDAAISVKFPIGGSSRLTVSTAGLVVAGILDQTGDSVRVRASRTPASASAPGAAGEWCWDASYFYVRTAANTWKRAALSTW